MMEMRRRADGQIRDEIDRISMLPDGILDSILSLLSLKEAIGTSILSSRWRYLWTFLCKLDFDGKHFKPREVRLETDEIEIVDVVKWKSNYMRGVDDVLALHKKESIEEFRIQFGLAIIDSSWIDKCVKFALAKKVEKLELDVYAANSYDLLGAVSDLVDNLKFLRTLSIKDVNVSGEALELLLCNSPLLEDLSVSDSGGLLTLRVIGPFPSLKRLDISNCYNLNLVEIRDANLVYLKYQGKTVPFILENVPCLLNLHCARIALDDLNDVVTMFASILPQLETFMVDFDYFEDFSVMETPFFRKHVKLNKLKQLVVTVEPWNDDEPLFDILPFVNFIAASPCLERFVIKSYRTWYFDPLHEDDEEREVKTIKRSYSCLREVEFVGYCGVISDLELIMHFLDNAAALEKIVVNTCYPRDAHLARVAYDSTRGITEEEEKMTRCKAMDAIKKQLTDIVPPKIHLKIFGSTEVVISTSKNTTEVPNDIRGMLGSMPFHFGRN